LRELLDYCAIGHRRYSQDAYGLLGNALPSVSSVGGVGVAFCGSQGCEQSKRRGGIVRTRLCSLR
jgi:hypothetical protein